MEPRNAPLDWQARELYRRDRDDRDYLVFTQERDEALYDEAMAIRRRELGDEAALTSFRAAEQARRLENSLPVDVPEIGL